MESLNKLSLPVTILLGCLILGGFYFAAETNEQKLIEKQQTAELRAQEEAAEAESRAEAMDQFARMNCAEEAEESAAKQYEQTCTYNCQEGYYYIANYENYLKSCLQRKGLE